MNQARVSDVLLRIRAEMPAKEGSVGGGVSPENCRKRKFERRKRMSKIFKRLPFKLLPALAVGMLGGSGAPAGLMTLIVLLIIIGFIACVQPCVHT